MVAREFSNRSTCFAGAALQSQCRATSGQRQAQQIAGRRARQRRGIDSFFMSSIDFWDWLNVLPLDLPKFVTPTAAQSTDWLKQTEGRLTVDVALFNDITTEPLFGYAEYCGPLTVAQQSYLYWELRGEKK